MCWTIRTPLLTPRAVPPQGAGRTPDRFAASGTSVIRTASVMTPFAALAGLILSAAAASAGNPVPIETVAKVPVLVVEVDSRLAELDTLLKDSESYEKGKELAIPSAAGVLACIGHAVAQHPEKANAGLAPLKLRDAALELAEAGDLDDARKALAKLKEARTTAEDAGDLAAQTWYDLIASYELMEEINTRNSKLVRVSRRPRGKPEEQAHAAVIALLCLPMHAQGEDYVDEDQLPDYQALTLRYLKESSEMSAAVEAKDGDAVKRLLVASKKTCDECHKTYRDGE